MKTTINVFLGAKTAYRELIKALCFSDPAGYEKTKVHLEKMVKKMKKGLQMEIN
jgi:hypothetical protein